MKFIRSLPLMCARTRWPFSSSTANIVFGSGSMTVPSTSIASFLATGVLRILFLSDAVPARRRADTRNAEGIKTRPATSGTSSARDVARLVRRVVRISGPLSVTAMVCSKWAASEPSRVTTVQPSAETSDVAAARASASARSRGTGPGSSCMPVGRVPKFGTWGSSCIDGPDAVADVLADDAVAAGRGDVLDRGRDVARCSCPAARRRSRPSARAGWCRPGRGLGRGRVVAAAR